MAKIILDFRGRQANKWGGKTLGASSWLSQRQNPARHVQLLQFLQFFEFILVLRGVSAGCFLLAVLSDGELLVFGYLPVLAVEFLAVEFLVGGAQFVLLRLVRTDQ